MRTSLLAVGLVIAGLASVASITAPRSPQRDSAQESAQPWQEGKCYRVFPADRDQLYVFKVLEEPAGQWVRVQADPAGIRVPGAKPQAPLWLNVASQFAVQEWTCSG
jgi:hypothetical protein